jgi:hypothetical protein
MDLQRVKLRSAVAHAVETQRSTASVYESVKQSLDASGIVSFRAPFTPNARVNWRLIRLANCGLLSDSWTLFINSLLFVGILALWLMGVERIAPSKPLMLASVLGAGVVTDVVILSLMPPLAK